MLYKRQKRGAGFGELLPNCKYAVQYQLQYLQNYMVIFRLLQHLVKVRTISCSGLIQKMFTVTSDTMRFYTDSVRMLSAFVFLFLFYFVSTSH